MLIIALWISIISGILTIVAIIALVGMKSSINEKLSENNVSQMNYEIKKSCIITALKLADEIIAKGQAITLNATFEKQAKQCYNELLCTASKIKLVDEFYYLSLDKEQVVTSTRLTQFKLLCREEFGLSTKKTKAIKQCQPINSKHNKILLKRSLLNSKLNNAVSTIDALVNTPKPRKEENL